MKNRNLARYNLVLPKDTYEKIKAIAEREGTTVLHVFRRFIALGILADKCDEITFKEKGSDSEKKVIFF